MVQISIQAYIEIVSELGKRQKQVLDALNRLRLATRLELAEYLRLPINSVTPRVKELMEQGVVSECGQKRNPHTNKLAYILKVV